MDVSGQWHAFLLRHPAFFELSKSGFFISLLNFLSGGAKTFNAMALAFPQVEENDLQVILSALEELGVVEKVSVGMQVFYLLTGDGSELLRAYKETKRFFEV